MKNKFVSFEGGEGCGKSTQIEKIKEYLTKNNIDYLVTREPGGNEICEKIRSILLFDKNELCANAQILLFSASRAQLTNQVIKPALAQGKIVVADRYYDSTYVYQGYAQNQNMEYIKNCTKCATDGLVPAVTFYFDLDPKIAMQRKEGFDKNDRFESKDFSFHQAVRSGYLKLAKENKSRIVVVDASKDIETISKEVIEELKNRKII